jgi:hypothetical protein
MFASHRGITLLRTSESKEHENLLGEVPTLAQILGANLVLSGLVVVERRMRHDGAASAASHQN